MYGNRYLLPSAMFLAGVAVAGLVGLTNWSFSPIDKAQAQGRGGKNIMGGRGGSGMGRQGNGGIAIEILRGKNEVRIFLEDEGDDDSDRPAWAGGNPDLNPHSPSGGGRPPTAGTKKGDLYGDLWIIVRDENGEPVLDENGHVQPILADGTVIKLTEDGEVPPEYAELLQEVEMGRLSVVRAPDTVLEHALDEALAKIEGATVITLDEAGRLVLDGSAIDSPLENIALYIYLMNDNVIDKLPDDATVTSFLGAASDKAEPFTIDEVVYLNTFMGINEITSAGDIVYYDYSTYGDYDRESTYENTTVTYLKDEDGDGTYNEVTEPIMEAVFGGEDWSDETAGYVDDFVQAADDARAVIEFIHSVPTAVVTE